VKVKKNLDFIQGNFVDSYVNLTYKTVMGLDWVEKFCSGTKFVLKVDDNTLIDPYHLVKCLFQKSPDGDIENFLYCSVYKNQGPVRRTSDKWHVPEDELKYAKYPPYCESFVYIMSRDVSKKLYDATRALKYYWIDDVYVTGFAAFLANIKHTIMENGHSYKLLEVANISKNVKSSMFLLAKYEMFRAYWNNAWNDIKAVNNIAE